MEGVSSKVYKLVLFLDLSDLFGVKYKFDKLGDCYDFILDMKKTLSFLNEDFFVRIEGRDMDDIYYKIGKDIKRITKEQFIKAVKDDLDKSLTK